jgi:asparagine synthase (glutamine-hydrolysing)
MCGIAGIVRLDGGPVERERLQSMANAISHRGPDGDGFLCDGPVGLAHRRLAIIDLETGDQPMGNEDGKVQTVFNGEIYNFRDLVPQLVGAGHQMRTHSDTEVLVHGWEQWGTDLPKKLNGMFALAMWDARKRTFFLTRDRLGVKPLYYYQGRDVLVYASEMSALLASGYVPREIDPVALDLYLHYQHVPAPLTIYKGVMKLRPAESLILDVNTGKIRLETYWNLPQVAPITGRSLESWIEEVGALLDDAVKIRLVSDVPFGAFLSGGTDSGIVVALMAKHMSEPVRTFSIGLQGESKDELPLARYVAQRFGTRHEEFHVAPEGLTLIPKLITHFGEPFADSSAIPTYYVSQMARQRVKMVLTGDGGDEMFAGYRSYQALAGTRPDGLPNARTFAPTPRSMREMAIDARIFAARVKRTLLGQPLPPLRDGQTPWFERYEGSMRHFSPEERRALLGPDAVLSSTDHFPREFPWLVADSPVAAAQYCDLKSYLPDDINVKVDRMSMANSLEVRSPLLDYRIAELAFSMPTEMKLDRPSADGSTGKRVLKEFAARHLGREHVYRPKEGFGIPVSRWLREDSSGYLRDTLEADSPVFDLLDEATVRRIVKEHRSGEIDHAPKLWNLLMLDAWLRHVHAGADVGAPEPVHAG